MATVAQVFTATGNGNGLLVRTNESYSYTMTGTFVGTWIVEFSKDGFNYTQVATGTGTQTAITVNVNESNNGNINVRFRCSAFTSGTLTGILSSSGPDGNINATETQIFNGLNTLTDAATITTDCNNGNVHTVTLAGNRTLGAPTNLKAGAEYKWIINQDGTGSRTLAYNAVFLFEAGVAPVLSTAANAEDVLVGICDGISIYCTLTRDFG